MFLCPAHIVCNRNRYDSASVPAFQRLQYKRKPQVVDEFGVFQGRGKHLPFQAMLRTQTGDCLLACGGVWVAKRGLLVAWVGFIGVGLDTVWR